MEKRWMEMENELKNRHKIRLFFLCLPKILTKPITFKDGIKDIKLEKRKKNAINKKWLWNIQKIYFKHLKEWLNQMLSKVYDSKNWNLIMPIEQGNGN